MSLKIRFLAVVALAVLGLLASAAFWLTTERSRILREKQDKVRNLVQTADSIVRESYALQQAGMPQAEAQKHAIQWLKCLRYDGDNYFWINDLRPSMVMHPTKPALDGTGLGDFKDPSGKALFVEMVATVRQSGSGFVEYEWPRPGSDRPVPKVSYVQGFAPWGWIVGTGIYVDDVNTIWRKNAAKSAAVMLLIMALLCVTSYSMYQRMFAPLNGMVARMQDVAQGEGDLTRRLEVPPDREVAELARAFNTFMDKLQAILATVARHVGNLAAAGEEISATSRCQAEGAQQQTDQIRQVATATQEMAATVQEVTAVSNRTSEAAGKAAQAARHGGEVVEQTLVRMQAIAASTGAVAEKIAVLGRQSEQIGKIVAVIDDIADQTNLLALNAAIEAARAGEQGRGFAVVADEVRKLAERTTSATKEIAGMIRGVQDGTRVAVEAIRDSNQEVDRGVSATREAGMSLREIIEISDRVGEMVSHIATSTMQQASATEDVNRSTEKIAEIATASANGARETNRALEDLARLAEDIQNQVGRFKLERAEEVVACEPPMRARAAGMSS